MSLAAAVGYVVGIIIFALFLRRYRQKMIEKYLSKAETKTSHSGKDNQND